MGAFPSSPTMSLPSKPHLFITHFQMRNMYAERGGHVLSGPPDLRLLHLVLVMTWVAAAAATRDAAPCADYVVVGSGQSEAAEIKAATNENAWGGGFETDNSTVARSSEIHTAQPRALERHIYVFKTPGKQSGTSEQGLSNRSPRRQNGHFDHLLSASARVSQQLLASPSPLDDKQLPAPTGSRHTVGRQEQQEFERQILGSRNMQTSFQQEGGARGGQSRRHEARRTLERDQRQQMLPPIQQRQHTSLSGGQQQRTHRKRETERDTSQQNSLPENSRRIRITSFTASDEISSQKSQGGRYAGNNAERAEELRGRDAAAAARPQRIFTEDKDVAILCAATTCSEKEVEGAVKEIMRRAISMKLSPAKLPETAAGAATGQQDPFRDAARIMVEEGNSGGMRPNEAPAARRGGNGSALKRTEYIIWAAGEEEKEAGERKKEYPQLLKGQENEQQLSHGEQFGKGVPQERRRAKEIRDNEEANAHLEQADGNGVQGGEDVTVSSSATRRPPLGLLAKAAHRTMAIGRRIDRRLGRGSTQNQLGGIKDGTTQTSKVEKGEEQETTHKEKRGLLPALGGPRHQAETKRGKDGADAREMRRKEKEVDSGKGPGKLTKGACAVDFSTLKHLKCHIIKLQRCSQYIDPDLLIEIAEQHPCISEAALDARATPDIIELKKPWIIPASHVHVQSSTAAGKAKFCEKIAKIPKKSHENVQDDLNASAESSLTRPSTDSSSSNSSKSEKTRTTSKKSLKRSGIPGSRPKIKSSNISAQEDTELSSEIESTPHSNSSINNSAISNSVSTNIEGDLHSFSKNVSHEHPNTSESTETSFETMITADKIDSSDGGPKTETRKLSSDSFAEYLVHSTSDSRLGSEDKIDFVVLENDPNDPLYASVPQWELRGRVSGVDAPKAWLLSKGHEDLWEKWWRNADRGPTTGRSEWPANCDNGIDDDENGYIDDCFGFSFSAGSGAIEAFEGFHGTEVAGVCCADTNNRKGVAAIGWNLRPMPLHTDGKYSQLAEALNYAADKGVRVMNVSMGGPPTAALRRLVMEAEKRDILMVVAAGNHSCDLGTIHTRDCRDRNGLHKGYPAAYSDRHRNLVSVGASDPYGRFAWYSNYDATPGRARVQVVTPGTDVTLCTTDDEEDAYSLGTGTSFAAPFVTGIAGLLRYERPELSAADVRDILVNSCVSVRHSNLKGASECGGILNASSALQLLKLSSAFLDSPSGAAVVGVGNHYNRSKQKSDAPETTSSASGTTVRVPIKPYSSLNTYMHTGTTHGSYDNNESYSGGRTNAYTITGNKGKSLFPRGDDPSRSQLNGGGSYHKDSIYNTGERGLYDANPWHVRVLQSSNILNRADNGSVTGSRTENYSCKRRRSPGEVVRNSSLQDSPRGLGKHNVSPSSSHDRVGGPVTARKATKRIKAHPIG